MDMISAKSAFPKSSRVGIDCGNGTASLFAEKFFSRLGVEVYPLYCTSDPSFPNHFPDPVNAENLADLRELVLREQLDLGIGFDGDGDRIGVVDDRGNVIFGDMLMILYWREIMPKYPGSTAIVEVKCSEALVDEIKTRWQAHILQNRPLLDQSQDERSRCNIYRRNVRPHVLCR